MGRSGFVDALFALSRDTLLSGNTFLLSRSTDGGASWVVVNDGVGIQPGAPDSPDGFFALPPGHAHAGRLLAGGVVLYSDDRGATWTEASQDIPTNSQSSARSFAALPSGRVLAGTGIGGGVLGSDDGGAAYLRTPLWGTFSIDAVAALATPGSRQTGAPACGRPDGALCDGAVAVGISTQLPYARAWRTADGGRTWAESVALPEPSDGVGTSLVAGVVALSPGPDGLGRAITIGGRGIVRRTVDGGQSWEIIGRMPLRLGGASHYTRLLRLGPDGHLWVSTTINGSSREWLYRSVEPAEAAFLVAGESGPPAEGVKLVVHPNPSGGRVVVRLTLPSSSVAVALVYDALGRRVAVLHDGPLAAGAHPFALDASVLAPGVYVVHVRVSPEGGAVSWTAVRRLTVTR